MALTKDMVSRGLLLLYDLAGVSTTDANEKNLFVNASGEGHVTNGFVDLGRFAGSQCRIEWYESAGNAGTLRIYGALTAATSYQHQIGAGETITASSGGFVVLSVAPKFLRLTIQRSGGGDITVRYMVTVPKVGGTL